ncbi:TDP-N-acetylfucosamine:lipid II N-acetylfucosaminyltransferase [Marinobacter sp.]|uniref:TDP-N-acetylfucosamine:lipid II N-acetylfucosaminyltransferase n=1 Tax=Marinobacter sp. TaxID=50741 RepID=UPI003A8D398E
MILHVAGLGPLIPPFIKLIEQEFPGEDHQFWLRGAKEKYPVHESDKVYVCSNRFFKGARGYFRLLYQLHSAKKIILHGLFDIRVIALLVMCPWLLAKCYWVIWGGDLYQYTKSSEHWKSRVSEILRRYVIRRVGHLVTYIDGDVELAREWYGAKGKHHECLMYLSNVVDPKVLEGTGARPHHKCWNILLGNSADPSNNHIEALERMLPFKDEAFKIYVPLSYGDQNHARKVIKQGKEWFGEKIEPLTGFMPFEQYLEFLKNIDIAIFNHRRQQAMGNTITLLGMGKTVFMRSDVSQWHFLKGLGVKLNEIDNLDLCILTTKEAEGNVNRVYSYFSKENLISQLEGVLTK